MTIDNLTTGMRVTYRNGSQRIVLLNTADGDILTNLPKRADGGEKNKFARLRDEYNADLTSVDNHDQDIVMVEAPESRFRYLSNGDDYITVWERPVVRQMHLADIEAALGYAIEII